MLKIFPYKIGSESAKDIARALKVKRIIPTGTYAPSDNCVVVNWGNSSIPFRNCKVVNKPEAVARAANKLSTFQALREANIPIPEFTTDQMVAQTWANGGSRVFVRHKLTGHNGEGIEIVEAGGHIPYAPLYTKYKRKSHEYRVHVFNGKIIDITEKRRRDDSGSSYIRNLNNGWVFCRSDVYPHPEVKRFATLAVSALGLDFGGVDVIERDGLVYVLEVNSAPGVQATTLNAYVNAIKETYGYAIKRKINGTKRRGRSGVRLSIVKSRLSRWR